MNGHPESITRGAACAAVTGGLLLALVGCTSTPALRMPAPGPASGARVDSQPVVPDLYAHGEPETPIEAVRTGRYQLTTLDPSAGQRDLLRQTVTMALPQSMDLSVGDGLTNALRDSGLRLCARDMGRFSAPLPAVHRELGPTTLATALQLLAGPAWRLTVDYVDRTACFDRRAADARRMAGPRIESHVAASGSSKPTGPPDE